MVCSYVTCQVCVYPNHDRKDEICIFRRMAFSVLKYPNDVLLAVGASQFCLKYILNFSFEFVIKVEYLAYILEKKTPLQ